MTLNIAIAGAAGRMGRMLIDTLEDHDDVQAVFYNADISDEVMEKLAE